MRKRERESERGSEREREGERERDSLVDQTVFSVCAYVRV